MLVMQGVDVEHTTLELWFDRQQADVTAQQHEVAAELLDPGPDL